MESSSTLQNSLSPPDDEPTVSDILYHQMSSFNRPAPTFPPSDSSTSANPMANRFSSFGRARTVTSPNSVGTASAFGSAANMMSYPFNAPINLGYMNGYPESYVSSDRYPSYHREEATTTHTIMDNIAPSQNYYSTTNFMRATYGPQHSLAYSGPVHNPARYPGTQHHNTAQGGVEFWHSDIPVTDANYSLSYPPQMQCPDGYTSYPSQYASPNSDASSSSHHESSSYRREVSHPDPSAYHHEAYQAQREPQPLTSAAMSYPNISHGGNISHPSYRQPTIQPHEDLPRRNSRSRQNSRRRSRSHTHGTHHSPSDIFSCGWLVGENKTCGFEGPLDKFKTHFRSSHLSGAQNAPNVCRWQGCKYRKRDNATIQDMRRDSAWRHVRETHLGIKRN
ncbi:hypothetical protein C8R48DRAFT_140500 [Suillus tomentosus]|nr:hypothetical protein C8R48DRAFT_140500 [Suillus tomentosus]